MALFFPASHQITRHRNWLEQLDQSVADRSRTGVFSFLMMLLLLAFLLREQLDQHLLLLNMVAVLLMAPVRFYWVWRFTSLHGRGAAYWRNRFFIITLANIILWNLLGLWVFAQGEFNLATTLMLIFQAAMAAGSAMLYAPFKQFGRLYLALLLLPPALILAVVNPGEFGLVSLGLVLLMFYLQIEQGKISQVFWDQSNHIFNLQQEVGESRSKQAQAGYRRNVNHLLISNIAAMLEVPMKRLHNFLGPLEHQQLDSDNKQSLKLAMRTCDNISQTLSDIQAYSALRNKQFQIELSTVNLSRLSEKIMETAGPAAHEENVELSYLEDFDVPERVQADGPHLVTVLTHLLNLCISASRAGEMSFKLSCMEKEDRLFLKWQIRFYLDNSQSLLADLEEGKLILQDNRPSEDLTLRNLSLVVSLKLLHLMHGQLDFRYRQDDSFEVLVLMPLEASSQQQRQFQPDRQLAGLRVALIGMPNKGGRALLAELGSWNIKAQCHARLEDLDQQLLPQIVFANLPVSFNNDQAELAIQALKDYCTTIQADLMLYCSYPHQQTLKEILGNTLVVPKPVSRMELHKAFLQAINPESGIGILQE